MDVFAAVLFMLAALVGFAVLVSGLFDKTLSNVQMAFLITFGVGWTLIFAWAAMQFM